MDSRNCDVRRQFSRMKIVWRNLIARTSMTECAIFEVNREPLCGLAGNGHITLVANGIEACIPCRGRDCSVPYVNKGPNKNGALEQPAVRMTDVRRRLYSSDSGMPDVNTNALAGVTGKRELNKPIWMPISVGRICFQVR